jgi:hypothetical protein
MKKSAIKIANEIIANGRINDMGDWHEMKLELVHEMNEQGFSKQEQEKALATVKKAWY